jgi:hypothetical protein
MLAFFFLFTLWKIQCMFVSKNEVSFISKFCVVLHDEVCTWLDSLVHCSVW